MTSSTPNEESLAACPGCFALLPPGDGPIHRYIGASAACWQLFGNLANGGQPPLAPGPLNGLLLDAYAVQHPGTPSPQAIQSVAVHLLTLHGVLAEGVAPGQVLWLRRRGVRDGRIPRHERFHWLTPPDFQGSLTVAAIAAAPTPAARTELVQRYVNSTYALWAAAYPAQIAAWYARFITAAQV